MTKPTNLAPPRPHLAPTAGGDLRNRPRPSPPTPTGGVVELEPKPKHTNHPTSPHQNGATFPPHLRTLIAAFQADPKAYAR